MTYEFFHPQLELPWEEILRRLGYQDGIKLAVRYGQLRELDKNDNSSDEDEDDEQDTVEETLAKIRLSVKALDKQMKDQMLSSESRLEVRCHFMIWQQLVL